MDLYEFKATLGLIRSMLKLIQMVVAHTFTPVLRNHAFNPSTRGSRKWEERTGRIA